MVDLGFIYFGLQALGGKISLGHEQGMLTASINLKDDHAAFGLALAASNVPIDVMDNGLALRLFKFQADSMGVATLSCRTMTGELTMRAPTLGGSRRDGPGIPGDV